MSDQTGATTSTAIQTEAIKVRLQAIFKQVDLLIKDGAFEKARGVLADARKLDTGNPFIAAFEERIQIFENKKAAPKAESGHAQPRTDNRAHVTAASKPHTSKHHLTGYYTERMNELDERFKAAQADLMDRERQMLSRREMKVREEFRQQLENLTTSQDQSTNDPRVLRQREMDRTREAELLAKKMEEQLARERDIFSAQYSLEHGKLQQQFLADQRKLVEEQQLDMNEQIQSIRKREAEEFEQKRQQVFRELEDDYQAKVQELTAREAAVAAASSAKSEQPAEPPAAATEEYLRPVHDAQVSAEETKRIRQELRDQMEKSFLERIEQLVAAYNKKMDLLGFVMPQSKEEAAALYRKKLKECYASGQPTVSQAEQLMEFKELLELTFDEHAELEKSVRLELYVEQVEHLVRAPGGDLRGGNVLEALKTRYGITPEESAQLEPFFLSTMERMAVRGNILLADDDPNIRMSLDAVLTANGYRVTLCESVPKAMEALRAEMPDLIISDLKFGHNEPDGFQFFTMVQKEPLLRRIPFLLLSAMTDNVYVRTGVQLGVDDYLTKPIDPDFLVAVVEGKLKRFGRS